MSGNLSYALRISNIYDLVWFGLVLWHINHCSLFNAKSFLYIHIRYKWFSLAGFYSMSTTVGYLMPNPLYTYIKYMICKHILSIIFLNEPELIF